MLAIAACVMCFALLLLMYGIFRNSIMTHLGASILIGTIWNFCKFRQENGNSFPWQWMSHTNVTMSIATFFSKMSISGSLCHHLCRDCYCYKVSSLVFIFIFCSSLFEKTVIFNFPSPISNLFIQSPSTHLRLEELLAQQPLSQWREIAAGPSFRLRLGKWYQQQHLRPANVQWRIQCERTPHAKVGRLQNQAIPVTYLGRGLEHHSVP